MILDILYWIGTNILGQAIILLGIAALVGLLLQRKPTEEVVNGTVKVMIGVAMMAGASLFVQELVNFQSLLGAAIGVQPKYPPGYTSMDTVVVQFGSYVAMIMTIALANNHDFKTSRPGLSRKM
ncbi:MAG: PTS transporter subunit IIC [Thermosphaera sp.]